MSGSAFIRPLKRLALAHPNVSFRLKHNDRLQGQYVAVEDAKQRLYDVLGPSWKGQLCGPVTDKMVSRDEQTGDTMTVYFARPTLSFGNSKQQYFFLNRRSIVDRSLSHALSEAYRTLVMDRRYPGAVVFLEMDPANFDVNVHPAKEEVRFVKARALHQQLFHLLRGPLVSLKLEGVSTGIADSGSGTGLSSGRTDWGRSVTVGSSLKSVQADPPVGGHRYDYERLPFAKPLSEDAREVVHFTGSQHEQGHYDEADRARHPSKTKSRFFSDLRIIGQYDRSYILCEYKSDAETALVLIDQHAAHERILFAEFRDRYAKTSSEVTQQLLTPLHVELDAGDVQTLRESGDVLRSAGFDFEAF